MSLYFNRPRTCRTKILKWDIRIFTHLIFLFPRSSSNCDCTQPCDKLQKYENYTVCSRNEPTERNYPTKTKERKTSTSLDNEKAPSLSKVRDDTASIEKTLEAIRNRSPTKINERQMPPTPNYLRDNTAAIDASRRAPPSLLDTTFLEDPTAEKSKDENDLRKTIYSYKKPNGEADKTHSKWFDSKSCSPTCAKTQETQNYVDSTRLNESKSLKDPTPNYSKWVMEKSPYKQSSTKDLHIEGVSKRIEPRTATDANKSKASSARNSLIFDGISTAALFPTTTGADMADAQSVQDQKTDQTTQKTDDRSRPCHCCACCHQAQMTTSFNAGDSRPTSPRSGGVPLINHTLTYTLCHSECSSTCGSYRGKS